MKRCPECRRDYYDDSLAYCLDDGTALVEGPVSEFHSSEAPTAVLPASEAATIVQPVKRNDLAPASSRHSTAANPFPPRCRNPS
jgi:hypothetical protein